MKKCPRCNRQYDDSWSVCLHCETPLNDNEKKETAKKDQGQKKNLLGDNFISKQIKRTNRNLLLVNIASLICIILMWLNNAFYGAGYWGLVIFAGVALNIWNIVKAWKRNRNPARHPISCTLTKFGPAPQLARAINEEIKASDLYIKPLIITESWLFKPTFFGMEINLLAELAWVHKKVTQHYTYFIPTNKSFEVIIFTREGKSIDMSCSETDSDRLMQAVMNSAPWVVAGYSDEIQKLWDTDRAGFIAYIDQRKRELKSGAKSQE